MQKYLYTFAVLEVRENGMEFYITLFIYLFIVHAHTQTEYVMDET